MAKKTKSSAPKNSKVLDLMQEIFQEEMSGVLRYLHYSFMIMGHNRIPIQKWFRDQAQEAIAHATLVGEKITALGGHPELAISNIRETQSHAVDEILKETLEFEMRGLEHYKKLVHLAVAEDDMALEEFARGLVLEETTHIEEVQKMLKRPN